MTSRVKIIAEQLYEHHALKVKHGGVVTLIENEGESVELHTWGDNPITIEEIYIDRD